MYQQAKPLLGHTGIHTLGLVGFSKSDCPACVARAGCRNLLLSWLHVYTYHQLLSNHWGFKINSIMKCGTHSTVVIMQAVYCLIGSVKKN